MPLMCLDDMTLSRIKVSCGWICLSLWLLHVQFALADTVNVSNASELLTALRNYTITNITLVSDVSLDGAAAWRDDSQVFPFKLQRNVTITGSAWHMPFVTLNLGLNKGQLKLASKVTLQLKHLRVIAAQLISGPQLSILAESASDSAVHMTEVVFKLIACSPWRNGLDSPRPELAGGASVPQQMYFIGPWCYANGTDPDAGVDHSHSQLLDGNDFLNGTDAKDNGTSPSIRRRLQHDMSGSDVNVCFNGTIYLKDQAMQVPTVPATPFSSGSGGYVLWTTEVHMVCSHRVTDECIAQYSVDFCVAAIIAKHYTEEVDPPVPPPGSTPPPGVLLPQASQASSPPPPQEASDSAHTRTMETLEIVLPTCILGIAAIVAIAWLFVWMRHRRAIRAAAAAGNVSKGGESGSSGALGMQLNGDNRSNHCDPKEPGTRPPDSPLDGLRPAVTSSYLSRDDTDLESAVCSSMPANYSDAYASNTARSCTTDVTHASLSNPGNGTQCASSFLTTQSSIGAASSRRGSMHLGGNSGKRTATVHWGVSTSEDGAGGEDTAGAGGPPRHSANSNGRRGSTGGTGFANNAGSQAQVETLQLWGPDAGMIPLLEQSMEGADTDSGIMRARAAAACSRVASPAQPGVSLTLSPGPRRLSVPESVPESHLEALEPGATVATGAPPRAAVSWSPRAMSRMAPPPPAAQTAHGAQSPGLGRAIQQQMAALSEKPVYYHGEKALYSSGPGEFFAQAGRFSPPQEAAGSRPGGLATPPQRSSGAPSYNGALPPSQRASPMLKGPALMAMSDNGLMLQNKIEDPTRAEAVHNSGSGSGSGSQIAKLRRDEEAKEQVEAFKRQIAASRRASSAVSDVVEIIELIGNGTYGKVYRGIWSGSVVAVKTMALPGNMLSGNAGRERMALMEAAISSSLSHPSIVQTYTYGIVPIKSSQPRGSQRQLETNLEAEPNNADDSFPRLRIHKRVSSGAGGGGEETPNGGGSSTELPDVHGWEMQLVLEYCDMGTLREALTRKVFGETARGLPPGSPTYAYMLRVALDIANAMAHLHSLDIIHSDLKARNVLLKSDPKAPAGFVAKVSDFGLSQKIDPSATHISDVYQGTLTHMAPEVLLNGRISKAADVYSFGILLFELYTGAMAFNGIPRAVIGFKVSIAHLRPSFPPTCPPELVALAAACWSREPQQRPTFVQVATQLRDMLRTAQGGSSGSDDTLLKADSAASLAGVVAKGARGQQPGYSSGRVARPGQAPGGKGDGQEGAADSTDMMAILERYNAQVAGRQAAGAGADVDAGAAVGALQHSSAAQTGSTDMLGLLARHNVHLQYDVSPHVVDAAAVAAASAAAARAGDGAVTSQEGFFTPEDGEEDLGEAQA